MVFFAIPVITSVISGIIYHLIKQSHRQDTDQNNLTASSENGQQRNCKQRNNKTKEPYQLVENSKGKKKKRKQYFEINKNQDEKLTQNSESEQQNFQQDPKQQIRKYVCPITKNLINQPGELLCGHYFQKSKIIKEIKRNKKCPICNKKARCSEIFQSKDFKNMIQEYKARKQARKWSRDRLFEDFGDDRFEYIIRGKQIRAYAKNEELRNNITENLNQLGMGDKKIKIKKQQNYMQYSEPQQPEYPLFKHSQIYRIKQF